MRRRVGGGTGAAFEVRSGQVLWVTDVEGKQVVDLIAFVRDDFTEFLSTSHTIVRLKRLVPRVGDAMLSNRRRPLLELVHDDVGRHDLLIAACDPWRYEFDYGVTGHRNCSDNFLEALRPYGVQRHQLPNPVNLFQKMLYAEDGSVVFCESESAPGSRVAFRALRDLVVAVSACPMDLNPISGYRVTDAEVEVTG